MTIQVKAEDYRSRAMHWALWALDNWTINYRGNEMGVTVKHVARVTGISRSSMQRAFGKLYQMGYCTRAGRHEYRYFKAK